MKEFVVTIVNRTTKETKTIIMDKSLLEKQVLLSDIPKRIGQTKCISRYDTFSEQSYITLITMI